MYNNTLHYYRWCWPYSWTFHPHTLNTTQHFSASYILSNKPWWRLGLDTYPKMMHYILQSLFMTLSVPDACLNFWWDIFILSDICIKFNGKSVQKGHQTEKRYVVGNFTFDTRIENKMFNVSFGSKCSSDTSLIKRWYKY